MLSAVLKAGTSEMLFRKSDSVVEKMVSKWLTICLYDSMSQCQAHKYSTLFKVGLSSNVFRSTAHLTWSISGPQISDGARSRGRSDRQRPLYDQRVEASARDCRLHFSGAAFALHQLLPALIGRSLSGLPRHYPGRPWTIHGEGDRM